MEKNYRQPSRNAIKSSRLQGIGKLIASSIIYILSLYLYCTFHVYTYQSIAYTWMWRYAPFNVRDIRIIPVSLPLEAQIFFHFSPFFFLFDEQIKWRVTYLSFCECFQYPGMLTRLYIISVYFVCFYCDRMSSLGIECESLLWSQLIVPSNFSILILRVLAPRLVQANANYATMPITAKKKDDNKKEKRSKRLEKKMKCDCRGYLTL